MGANASSPSFFPAHSSRDPGSSSLYAGSDSGGRYSSSIAGGGVVDDSYQNDTGNSSSTAAMSRSAAANVDETTRKKKASKFATLRKKLTRVRRHSRSTDHGRAMRELTSTWTVRELHSLNDDYEASAALKELTSLADAARPPANTVVDDLAVLYQTKYCTDVDLVYLGTVFPSHRAILCVRCPYFRELLARHPEFGARVPVDVRTAGVDVALFSALLRYLYTGDFGFDEARLRSLRKLLAALAHEFGAPNSLEQDLRTLFDTGAYADAVLVFSSSSSATDSPSMVPRDRSSCVPTAATATAAAGRADMGVNSAGTFRNDSSLGVVRRSRSELRCHRAMLAARSTFFRNLILRRARSDEAMTERSCGAPMYIVLDESVIPRRYARALLTAVYLDTVDTTSIMRSSVSLGTLSEVQAAVTGGRTTHWTTSDEAMELYHIGKFLELTALANGCEDIIAEAITIENLPRVLYWSLKPHGSSWVHRQALHFLREEFVQIVHHPVLFELSRTYLIEAISSDFLQASELDVLTAVVKWSEHQLIKRIEDREPNLLTHTAHSISRKGVKKRDMNDIELRDILADLLPYVRTDHVVPVDSDVLVGAIKRGLISVPPSHMIGSDVAATAVAGGRSSASAWVRTRNTALFVRPRLFTPYYDEVKALLKEQTVRGMDNGAVQLRVMHTCAIPDALYMLDDRTCPLQLHQQHVAVRHQRHQQHQRLMSSTVDIIAGTIPVPESDVVETMRQRENELSRTKLVQRACSLLCSDRIAITRQIQLRVVREFGLPDSTVEVLRNAGAASAFGPDYQRSPVIRHDSSNASMFVAGGSGMPCHSSSAAVGFCGGGGQHWRQVLMPMTERQHRCQLVDAERRSPLILAPMVPCPVFEDEPSSGTEDAESPSSFRCAMPDIAMASSSVGRSLHLEGNLAEDAAAADSNAAVLLPVAALDLGDGANHSMRTQSGSMLGPLW